MEGTTVQMRESQMLRLRSLDPGKKYRINNDAATYTGDYLMKIGIRWPVQGAYKSAVIRITEI